VQALVCKQSQDHGWRRENACTQACDTWHTSACTRWRGSTSPDTSEQGSHAVPTSRHVWPITRTSCPASEVEPPIALIDPTRQGYRVSIPRADDDASMIASSRCKRMKSVRVCVTIALPRQPRRRVDPGPANWLDLLPASSGRRVPTGEFLHYRKREIFVCIQPGHAFTSPPAVGKSRPASPINGGSNASRICSCGRPRVSPSANHFRETLPSCSIIAASFSHRQCSIS